MRVTASVLVAGLLAASAASGAPPSTRLLVTLYPQGPGAPGTARHYVLRCEPAAGTVPRPARACRLLLRLPRPFAPVPPGTVCSQLALGPQEAFVSGRLRGAQVNAHLVVRDSCEIARWRRLAAVVPGFPGP